MEWNTFWLYLLQAVIFVLALIIPLSVLAYFVGVQFTTGVIVSITSPLKKMFEAAKKAQQEGRS